MRALLGVAVCLACGCAQKSPKQTDAGALSVTVPKGAALPDNWWKDPRSCPAGTELQAMQGPGNMQFDQRLGYLQTRRNPEAANARAFYCADGLIPRGPAIVFRADGSRIAEGSYDGWNGYCDDCYPPGTLQRVGYWREWDERGREVFVANLDDDHWLVRGDSGNPREYRERGCTSYFHEDGTLDRRGSFALPATRLAFLSPYQ